MSFLKKNSKKNTSLWSTTMWYTMSHFDIFYLVCKEALKNVWCLNHCLRFTRVKACWGISQLVMGARDTETPWKGCQSITGRMHVYTLTRSNSVSNWYGCMLLDCGRKPETQDVNSTQKRRMEPRILWLKDCYALSHHASIIQS